MNIEICKLNTVYFQSLVSRLSWHTENFARHVGCPLPTGFLWVPNLRPKKARAWTLHTGSFSVLLCALSLILEVRRHSETQTRMVYINHPPFNRHICLLCQKRTCSSVMNDHFISAVPIARRRLWGSKKFFTWSFPSESQKSGVFQCVLGLSISMLLAGLSFNGMVRC